MRWSVPPLWRGRTVAVLASGPSMSQEIADLVRAAGIRAIVVNDTYRLAPWADLLYAADAQWWECNPESSDFCGLKASVSAVPGVLQLQNTGTDGFEPHRMGVRTGGNSGYQAVHIAIHGEASRILLCGFDMSNRAGLHWHGAHPAPLRNTDDHSYTRWADRFAALKDIGPEIINCTPASAITCFPRLDLYEALDNEHHSRHAAAV
ncbi:hypothetical protein [Variovorax sp. JS1663]|uniref:hypothetical protein n=1 Tax=Variovorax sp. JS1663 TaxID=1851577 RepID=UPI000B3492DB|nr:hypothetical protein [Variovorax sp. JS1663]